MLRLSTCSNRSFRDETVKNFSRVSCRYGQSSNICLTVSGSLQDSQTGWSSPRDDWYGSVRSRLVAHFVWVLDVSPRCVLFQGCFFNEPVLIPSCQHVFCLRCIANTWKYQGSGCPDFVTCPISHDTYNFRAGCADLPVSSLLKTLQDIKASMKGRCEHFVVPNYRTTLVSIASSQIPLTTGFTFFICHWWYFVFILRSTAGQLPAGLLYKPS